MLRIKVVLQAIETERCTAIHGVPTMFIAELEHAQFSHYDMSSLRTGIMAGAPCLPELMKRVMEDMHCPEILIGYGETEASPLTHLTTRDDSMERRTETVGKNLPHQEVKIVSLETGETVPLGEIGEICFRGYHIMRGYYGDAEATAKAVDKLIVVVEPGRRSIETAEHIRKLAGEIGLDHIAVVGNKVRGAKDEKFLKTHLDDFEFLGFLLKLFV